MTELTTASGTFQMVPAGYAEKAMASLMQLHSELMSEKEKRVDLFRQLMEREQAFAELKLHVKQLEANLKQQAVARVDPVPPVVETPSAIPPPAVTAPQFRVVVKAETSRAPVANPVVQTSQVRARRPDGWKVW